ncbi:MAG TPA: methyltransferase domain-containing protein [Candidatus Didemnitutus sp.]|nr:methyltransferase domain-containing protein [Candidatus Didemnitutus sp.]
MSPVRWQRFTSRCIAAILRAGARLGVWVRSRPALAPWVFGPAASDDERYRRFNVWCFARFDEQERMLADRVRMDFYHAAISRHVQPGDRVLDLGTGTGILAAMASRRGAARVIALDHSDILKQARALAADNGVRNVDFVASHSREFHTDEKLDVILQEQMGDFLFDESMVANVVDLRDRVLKPGGTILPARFEFFCEPVQLREGRRVPFIWELVVHGYRYAALAKQRPADPSYYRHALSDPAPIERFLATPEPMLTLDLNTVIEDDLPCDLSSERVVAEAGHLDGFAVFFRAHVDDDLVLSTDPLDPARAAHWGVRILRVDDCNVARGDTIHFNLRVGRWSDPDTWRWEHQVTPAAVESAGAASRGAQRPEI